MAVLPLVLWPDPGLQTVCDPVAGGDAAGLVRDLFDTLYASGGRGLAAPQVGVTRRVFVMDTGWKDGAAEPRAFVDPVIRAVSDRIATGPEGCLSIPGITVEVARPDWVDLGWTDLDGAARGARFDGIAAVCVQHEVDHLDGIVTLDRLDPAARAGAEAAYGGMRA
ncbi:peptide deformylase [Pukyongiella litopenaei]|uniref:Peptide deformylase n=1 Tax=Pukyongiella litopenaei TaxID=2605946 RepID=A0A2S0MLQ7_9RHOB|nr:peptide deformylase [Pukyongiella litopenaei]AVO36820.1 peptide deformylase [Pukyongiella litopenaei]